MKDNYNVKTLGLVLVAGGSSTRMNGQDKMTLILQEQPVLIHSLEKFLEIPQLKKIVIVARKDLLADFGRLSDNLDTLVPITVIQGGSTRQESVFVGINKLKGFVDYYAIHDGARPLVHPRDIKRCFQQAIESGGATLGRPITDTIKLVDNKNTIIETLPRNLLYSVETPQIFNQEIYHQGMELALCHNKNYTDDCQLVEAANQPITIVESQHANLKLTIPEDIAIFEQLLKNRKGN